MDPSIWLEIVALVVCISLSAVFSAADTAYLAANRYRLRNMADHGRRGADLALRLQDDYDHLLTTILVGNNLVNIAAAAIATVMFTKLVGSGGPTLSTIAMTIAVLLFGEITPKTVAKERPERVAIALAKPLWFFTLLLKPVDACFLWVRRLLARLVEGEDEDSDIEEELITMVDEAQHEGDMDVHEGQLIRSAIEFSDQDAESIMTPRVDVTYLEETASMEEAGALFRESGYSRIPVVREDLDHVVGILYEKDFYRRQYEGCDTIRQIITPAVWAPATVKISRLLKLFQSSKTHLAVLVDEFGGTEGIVTLEDVLEELVGEIYDEHDDVSEEKVLQEDGSWLVKGTLQLTELLESFGLEDSYEADTVGGWAAEMLERIPAVGDRFEAGSLQCEVTEMDQRRVTQVRISKKEEASKPEDESHEQQS